MRSQPAEGTCTRWFGEIEMPGDRNLSPKEGFQKDHMGQENWELAIINAINSKNDVKGDPLGGLQARNFGLFLLSMEAGKLVT